MTVVLVVAIMIYFIRDQFEYSPVHRLMFLLVPLFTCYMFMKAFVWTPLNGGILVLLMLFLCLDQSLSGEDHTNS
ncbi:hypothetical protein L3X07_02230 [Levilactobacillus brevis]|nr:hypothetical protein [Levilactobacillus brevis]